MLLSL